MDNLYLALSGAQHRPVHDLPDPEWYLDNVLVFAEPGGPTRLPKGAAGRWQRWWARQVCDAEPIRTAARQGFVVATGQLAGLGVTRAAARHAVARGRWTVPQRGFVTPLQLDHGATRHTVARRVHAVRATSAVLGHPRLAVCARSAAILRGLPTTDVPDRPELTELIERGRERLGRQPVRHLFGAGLPTDAVDDWYGASLTTVARTLVDLARHDRRDAIMAADAALHEDLVSRLQLDAELDRAAGWPGVRQARAVLALTDPRAESPLESLVRLALHDSGFPRPEPQFVIGRYRVDLCWPADRLVVEVDGLGKYSDEAWRRRRSGSRRCGATATASSGSRGTTWCAGGR